MALCRNLLGAIREAEADPSAGAILLDGNGPVFCAGMDLDEVLDADAGEMIAVHAELFSIGAALRKPMVAAVQGAALGGGMGLALNAHMVVAASDARFGLTEARVGLWPYTIFRAVARAAGERRAVRMALTAEIFGAEEAVRLGVVDLVVPPEELQERAREAAQKMAIASATAVAGGLEFVRRVRALNDEDAVTLAIECRKQAQATPDFREGVRAFQEKRKPSWPSHRGGAD
jgi:enoyl-CoA hydratase/carnithine racemase